MRLSLRSGSLQMNAHQQGPHHSRASECPKVTSVPGNDLIPDLAPRFFSNTVLCVEPLGCDYIKKLEGI